jgi:hypothetical protein
VWELPNSLSGLHGRDELDANNFKMFPVASVPVGGSHVLVPRDRPVDTSFKPSISEVPVVFIHL